MTHPFETAGLGKAPFRFLGIEERVYQACQGAPIQPGGSCQYCGTGIRYLYHVQSGDGRRFHVGSECINKTCKPGGPILAAAQKAERKLMKEKRTVSLEERVAATVEKLAAMPELLTSKAHPYNPHKTLREYVEWCLKNAGAAGKTKVCKMVEKAT